MNYDLTEFEGVILQPLQKNFNIILKVANKQQQQQQQEQQQH